MVDAFKAVVNQTIKPIMKTALFKKKALNFYKEENGLIYLVNIQKSHGNSSNEVGFYINCCIHSNIIETELGQDSIKFPKEYQCHFQQRIEKLSPNAAAKFIVNSTTDIDKINNQLKRSFQDVLDFFQKISDHQSFIELLSKYGTLKEDDVFRFCLRRNQGVAANNLVGLFKQNIDQDRWEEFFKKGFIKIIEEENSTIKIENLI